MTEPVGEVTGVLRITTDEVPGDVEKGLREAGNIADKDLKKAGEDWGNTLSKSMEKELVNQAPHLAKSVGDAFSREKVVAKVTPQLDSDGNAIRRIVSEDLPRELERGLRDANSSGAFKQFQKIIGETLGPLFNIGAQSPIVFVLPLLVGIIAELVAAAVQAASALVALITIIPNLIGAIAVEAGVLFLVFHGLAGAIAGAFAATNADELQKALEGLTPAAQKFVKSLLPLRDFFKQLVALVQGEFFTEFGDSIDVAIRKLGAPLFGYLGMVAEQLGKIGRTIVTFFADPTFLRFFNELLGNTIPWLSVFSDSLQVLLTGLANLGTAVTPFFAWFGAVFNEGLKEFGEWLSKISQDKDFLAWLEHMKDTLSDVWEVLSEATGVLYSFANSLDKAGGNDLLKQLADQLETLKKFFASDLGQKALEGLLHVITVLAYGFVFLVLGVGLFLAALEMVLEFIKHGLIPWFGDLFTKWIPEWFDFAGQKIIEFVNWLFSTVGDAIMTFFTWIGDGVTHLVEFIGQAISDATSWIISKLFELAAWFIHIIQSAWDGVRDWFAALPGRIWDAIGDLGGLLVQAGRNLIDGLIQGIKDRFGPLANIAAAAVQIFKDHLPHSPAKTGPLSGSGDPMIAGQTMVKRLAEGMEMEGPALSSASSNAVSNVSFGPGAIVQNFNGLPTQNQAIGIGNGVAGGIADTLAVRNTVLAIRAM